MCSNENQKQSRRKGVKMTIMQKIGLILILITVTLIGCAQVKRGMLNDQIYYSTYDPKIQLKISEDFEYHTGKYSSKKQEFVNG